MSVSQCTSALPQDALHTWPSVALENLFLDAAFAIAQTSSPLLHYVPRHISNRILCNVDGLHSVGESERERKREIMARSIALRITLVSRQEGSLLVNCGAMPSTIMLSSPFLGCALLDRPSVIRQVSSRSGGARSALRDRHHLKGSTHPADLLAHYNRESNQTSPGLIQGKRRSGEVKTQAAASSSALFLPAVVAAGVFAWIVWEKLLSRGGKKLEIILGRGAGVNAAILPKLTELESSYKPYPLLSNCHVETIFAAYARSLPKLAYRRECLAMADGGTVALDWPLPEMQDPKAVLILLVRHTPPPSFSSFPPCLYRSCQSLRLLS